eukprot:1347939-Prymnesium_polylepis.1
MPDQWNQLATLKTRTVRSGFTGPWFQRAEVANLPRCIIMPAVGSISRGWASGTRRDPHPS